MKLYPVLDDTGAVVGARMMKAFFMDRTGYVFGRVTVLGLHTSATRKKVRWLCRCACGRVMARDLCALASGRTKSCGCRFKDTPPSNFTHGLSKTRAYRTWRQMLDRCYLRTSRSYRLYGARGIRVCARWRRSFTAFMIDMGPKPTSEHSIDRINNDGDYKPSNCRWATRTQQANNTRRTRFVYYRGERLPASVVAARVGIQGRTLLARLARGVPIERALAVGPGAVRHLAREGGG